MKEEKQAEVSLPQQISRACLFVKRHEQSNACGLKKMRFQPLHAWGRVAPRYCGSQSSETDQNLEVDQTIYLIIINGTVECFAERSPLLGQMLACKAALEN